MSRAEETRGGGKTVVAGRRAMARWLIDLDGPIRRCAVKVWLPQARLLALLTWGMAVKLSTTPADVSIGARHLLWRLGV